MYMKFPMYAVDLLACSAFCYTQGVTVTPSIFYFRHLDRSPDLHYYAQSPSGIKTLCSNSDESLCTCRCSNQMITNSLLGCYSVFEHPILRSKMASMSSCHFRAPQTPLSGHPKLLENFVSIGFFILSLYVHPFCTKTAPIPFGTLQM